MYRLLIVDDEEIIVNGLYEIFNSMKKLDLDVYKAYSGEEAVEWLNRTRMDIVLTDIRMPEVDGMQLLEEIYSNWPQCRVIFLTGYSEFDYVYKAIQHNNVSYILKTEDHEKVISSVENAVREIQENNKIEDLLHEAKEQMNMALELFQKDFFIRLLHKDLSLCIDKSQFIRLGVSFQPEQPVVLVMGHVDNMQTDLSYWDKIQYLYSVRLIIGQHLDTHIRNINILDENYRFVLLIQPKEFVTANYTKIEEAVSYKRLISFLKWMLEAVQTACRESLHASVSFVMGEPCRWEDISKKYYSLNQLLNYRIDSGVEMLLIDSELKNNILNTSSITEILGLEADTEPLEALLRQRIPDTLEVHLESGQRDKFFEILSELLTPLRTIRSKNCSIAIEAYCRISLILLSYINRWKLTEKIVLYTGLNSLMRIDEHETWEEAVEYIYNLSKIIFKLQSEEEKTRRDNVICYIQKFIEKNICEDLSLVRLGEQVYLNPSYLSRLYKQVTGTNLSDFIDNARINKAKELLEKGTVKIHEVARMVGYESAASFTRFFRRISGCSPQEYHDVLISGKQKTTM